MITFKDYLLEAAKGKKPKYESLSVEAAVNMLNTHCKDALWMLLENHPIYRGDKSLVLNSDFATVDPSKTKRVSANTSNHYTAILDHHPGMKNYPKRSRSFIASFSEFKTRMYLDKGQKPVILIPFDNVKIGCINSRDLWDIQVNLFGKIRHIYDWNEKFVISGIKPSWAGFKAFQYEMDIDSENEENDAFEYMFGNKAKKSNFLDEILSAYNPQKLGFTCHTTKTMPHKQDGEIWVGGPCMIVTYDMWEELRKSLQPG